MRGVGVGVQVSYDLRVHIPSLMLLGTTQRQRYTHGGDEAGWPQVLTAGGLHNNVIIFWKLRSPRLERVDRAPLRQWAEFN